LSVLILSNLWTVGIFGETITPPVVEWQKSFGGVTNEDCFVIRPAANGGCLVAGRSLSGASGNKETTNHGLSDGWVVRLDQGGHKLWEQSVGGTNYDGFTDVRQTSDGGWILAGGGSTTNALLTGYWVVRLDANGAFLWERNFAGAGGRDVAKAVLPTAEGGFLIGGWSMSGTNGVKTMPNIADANGQAMGPDFWVLRVDSEGRILWQNVYGGYREDNFSTIEPKSGGGFILVGDSSSPPSGNKQSVHYGGSDYWIVSTDEAGQVIWEKSYGGSGWDSATHVCPTPDGGCAVIGFSRSPADGNKTVPSMGGLMDDVWLLRVNGEGNKLWERNIGTTDPETPAGIQLTADGGFYVAVCRARPEGLFSWLTRLDANGNRVWENQYFSNRELSALAFALSDDGGFFLAGAPWPPNNPDFVVMKLSTDPLLLMPRLQMLSSEARVRLKGMPGKTYLTERTGNFLNWFPVSTNTLSSGEVEIIDSTSAPARFYRAMLVP
jgi:hypothetical protein